MSSITLSISDGIARLKLNRPDRLNAIDADAMQQLEVLCREIERSEDAHVVILHGEGKAFCAGGDIDAWSALSAVAFSRHWVREGHEALDRLARLRQPVIAVLNGHALGGGLELAACADIRIAEAHVRVGQPETGLGIIAGWSGTQRTVRRFGAQLVRRMALFGEVFEAQQACTLGLVDQVVERGQGLSAALALCEKLRRRAPIATELSKMMINAAEVEERERVVEALAGRIAASQDELQQGLQAFSQREMATYW